MESDTLREASVNVLLPTDSDIEHIKILNDRYLVNGLTENQKKSGFIRIKYSNEDLHQIVSNREIVVGKVNDQIVGYYLIGRKCGIEALKYQYDKATVFSADQRMPIEKVGFGCQVCIDENFRSNGLFGRMLKTLSQEVQQKYSHLLCSISQDNDTSLRSHRANGWQEIDTVGAIKFFVYKTIVL